MRQHDDKSRQCVPHSTHASLGTIWSANFVLCWLFPVFEGGVQKEKSLQVYELEGFGFGLTYFVCSFGGETGIRTLGTVARTPHFECGPIGHSGISPNRRAKITIPFDN